MKRRTQHVFGAQQGAGRALRSARAAERRHEVEPHAGVNASLAPAQPVRRFAARAERRALPGSFVGRTTYRTPARGGLSTPLRFLFLAWAVGLLFIPLQAQISRNIKTKNFSYPEFYSHTISPDNPTNRMKLLLRGALGQYYSNTLTGITTARLEHYPESGKGTNLVAITPFCFLDSGAHTVSSTNEIDIIANDGVITIRGERGFLFDMTNQFLYVSNRSRTVVLHGLSQKLR